MLQTVCPAVLFAQYVSGNGSEQRQHLNVPFYGSDWSFHFPN